MNLWFLILVAIVAKCSFAANQLDLVSKYGCYVEQTVIRIACLCAVVENWGVNWSINLSVQESLKSNVSSGSSTLKYSET